MEPSLPSEKLAAALVEAEAVLARQPRDAVLRGLAADAAEALGDMARAELHRSNAVAAAPQDPIAWQRLAALLKRTQPAKAIAVYQRAIALFPQHTHLHRALADLLREAARTAEAEQVLRHGLRHAPDGNAAAQMLNDYGLLLAVTGRITEAEAAYRLALRRQPGYAVPANNLGNLLLASGRHADAEAAYRDALAKAPDYALAAYNLANLLRDSHRLDDAEAAYRHALARAPQLAAAAGNLAIMLCEQRRADMAITVLRDALHATPAEPTLSVNLADLLHQRGDNAEAQSLVDAAILRHPADALLRLTRLMHALPALPDRAATAKQAPPAFDRALAAWIAWSRQPGCDQAAAETVGHKQPFYLAYRPGNHRARLSAFGDATAALMRKACPALPAPPPQRPRIRLAVITRHIRGHSVWTVLVHGLLARLDRSRFEIVLLHTGPAGDGDPAVHALVDRLLSADDSQLALDLLRQEQPDIVYYPEIGMDAVTNRLANLRLAPLQAAGWGHPVTSGLPDIDLYLSGALLEPANAAAHYRETLVRLPGTGACTLSPPVLAEPLPPAIAALLPDDRSVARLILCQHAFKFDPVDDALYAAIAAATAPCRIFVVLREDEPVQSARLLERLKHACSAAGIDGNAVLVPVPWLPTGQFYSLLDAMDVYLDCPGFSGYTTAWQALHRGLPIVTLEGHFMRQRLAAGALRQIGWPDTIATDRQGYVGIATRLVRQCRENPAAALALRTGLGAAAPQLDDDLRVVRAFEDSLVRELEVRRGRTDNGA